MQNGNHEYLCFTILLLLLPLFYVAGDPGDKPRIEYVLAAFLVPVVLFSLLLWNDPIKHSKIHKIDAVLAKLVIASYVLYTLLFKFKWSYLLLGVVGTASFYFSNYYSSKEWCSNQHLAWHACLHLVCFIATLYVFFPPPM